MEIGDSGNVLRVTCHGTRQEAVFVVNKVGDDHLHELLWELGDWGWACGGRPLGTPIEQPIDFGFGSVPKLVNEEFTRCRSVNATRLVNGR